MNDEKLESGLYQYRAANWMQRCFGDSIMSDRRERAHRFLEEAIELAQTCGVTPQEVDTLRDYVFSRPPGDLQNEVGGAYLTLACLCAVFGVDMEKSGEDELELVWTKIEKIREKHKTKPRGTALPGVYPTQKFEIHLSEVESKIVKELVDRQSVPCDH